MGRNKIATDIAQEREDDNQNDIIGDIYEFRTHSSGKSNDGTGCKVSFVMILWVLVFSSSV